MRLRKERCTCAYCSFYTKMLYHEQNTQHYTVFQEDHDLTVEEAFLVMDDRSTVNLEYVPATYFN